MELATLAEHIKQLSTDERYVILREIMRDEQVSISELIIAKVTQLEEFKRQAKRDIKNIAEAGMELGERELRQVTGIKGRTRTKTDDFKLAMVKCLVDAGAYRGSEYGKQLEAVDFSAVDKDWYEHNWEPKTTT